jgi:CheY-like chemotaxis protein
MHWEGLRPVKNGSLTLAGAFLLNSGELKPDMQQKGKILWADDEIDHLRSHILFLEQKGYEVISVANAADALSLVQKERFDLVLLDEMMPGMDGLEAAGRLKTLDPGLAIVMITKSEEEDLMEQAIGVKISDYLTKPVNPSQILSCCKRLLEKERISGEKLTRDYTAEFGEIANLLAGPMKPEDWITMHLRLSERELDFDEHPDLGLGQTLADQRRECNQVFGRYIQDRYESWIADPNRPVLSPDIVRRYLAPMLKKSNKPVFFLVIDNFRLDQWLTVEPMLYDFFTVDRQYYFSILPTATPFSRNSIFSGLLPSEIESRFPDLWKWGDDDESSQNRYEDQLLSDQLKRLKIELDEGLRYIKISDLDESKLAVKNAASFWSHPLTVIVINFVDILAHRRSDSQILREMIPHESAYRSLTRTWFEHSAVLQLLKSAAESGVRVVLTTDHGSIRAMRGSTVHADRETSTNLRYKYGRAIRGESKHVLEIKQPKRFGLPQRGLGTNYLIAKEDYYFVYPTNFHKYLALYRDSFQHGGISLEEMILPVVSLEPKT